MSTCCIVTGVCWYNTSATAWDQAYSYGPNGKQGFSFEKVEKMIFLEQLFIFWNEKALKVGA